MTILYINKLDFDCHALQCILSPYIRRPSPTYMSSHSPLFSFYPLLFSFYRFFPSITLISLACFLYPSFPPLLPFFPFMRILWRQSCQHTYRKMLSFCPHINLNSVYFKAECHLFVKDVSTAETDMGNRKSWFFSLPITLLNLNLCIYLLGHVAKMWMQTYLPFFFFWE